MTTVRRAFRLMPVAALLAFGGPAAVGAGSGALAMSAAQESEEGQKEHAEILQQYGRYGDEVVQAYVDEIGQRIAAKSDRPDLKYTFTVLDSDVINAWATPGGYVYITRGIMAYLNSEAELVAVLGHEVGHVTARHIARRQAGATAAGIGAAVLGVLTGSGDLANVANMAGSALVSSYGRDQELEADALGAKYLDRLGYDPKAIVDVVRFLQNQDQLEIRMAREEGREPHVTHGVFASHPDNEKRMQQAQELAAKMATGETRPDHRDFYLERINGLAVGGGRAQGVIRGSRFYLADLGFTMAFPAGWTVDNPPGRVAARTTTNDAVLMLRPMQIPPGMTPQHFLERLTGGVALSKQGPLEVNGLDGYTAIMSSAHLPWGNQGPMRVAVVYFNGRAFVFTGATRVPIALPASDPLMLASIKTFRRLKDNEFARAEPQRLQVIEAGAQSRVEDLAQESPLGKHAVEKLRLLNDLYPDKEPVAGQKLKIVE